LRFAAIFIGFLPLLSAEVLLRCLWNPPSPARSDPYLDWSEHARLFEQKDDAFAIPPERHRWFAPTTFSLQKASGTKRIFCLGGSTTQGEPFKPPTAFPAWLKINLELANPQQTFEVINCGGLSYASYRLLPLANEVLDYAPDLIILDCGHNEFLETRELAEWKCQYDGSVIQYAARASSVVQFFNNFFAKESIPTNRTRTRLERDVNALLDNQGGLEKYHRDDLDRDSVAKSMRWNVRAIVDACQRRQVPIVLLIPTSNVIDTPPFKVEINPSLDSDSQIQLEQQWEIALAPGQDRTAIHSAMLRILDLDSEHAGALYWLGQDACLQGQIEEATRYLKKARDVDVCPLRANNELMQSIRSIAEQTGTWHLDVNALFESVSEHSLVGNRWLVDHVHPRLEGHQLIGEKLAELLLAKHWTEVLSQDWSSKRVERYRSHLSTLGDDYFLRGKQRLEGLELWTQGRARMGRIEKQK
jgi:lysophospholipase L1-like esterase